MQASTQEPRVIIPNALSCLAAVITFSFLGVLSRVYLLKLYSFPGSPVFSVAVPNLIGCFVMGLVSKSQKKLVLVHPALFLALGTGFCGCLTTFSAWNLQAVELLFNTRQQSVMWLAVDQLFGWLMMMIIGLSSSISAFLFGQQVAQVYLPPEPTHVTLKPIAGGFDFPTLSSLPLSDLVFLCFSFLAWLTLLICSIFFHHFLVMDLLFAPLGAILRWRLALSLNGRSDFPWGTFAANVSGTWIAALCYFLRLSPISVRVGLSSVGCAVLEGVITGFCGSLTTVSTLVSELVNMAATYQASLLAPTPSASSSVSHTPSSSSSSSVSHTPLASSSSPSSSISHTPSSSSSSSSSQPASSPPAASSSPFASMIPLEIEAVPVVPVNHLQLAYRYFVWSVVVSQVSLWIGSTVFVAWESEPNVIGNC
eukprot:TRINITY_DN2015_c0_g1_i3.p1 TRINITY_DN2015_c0_g1~~TRINITY_DN2015_c0_g1_i3.p1  ORF type:complete len:424 (+),score=58.64 TRINITY_DN2015_c0_g1_i3:122-1393(+)